MPTSLFGGATNGVCRGQQRDLGQGFEPDPREMDVLWLTAGLGCDGDTIAMTAATQPSIEDTLLGAIPWNRPEASPALWCRADRKEAQAHVVDGQAFVSQHIGDLSDCQSLRAFQETIQDLISMYEVRPEDLLVVHDFHPQYASTAHALALGVPQSLAVQHHRAHVASMLAERGEWQTGVVGVSLDGTGYGDDGTIWGGEIFVGSVNRGFERVAHLRSASLPGGDAAAQHPVQAAAGNGTFSLHGNLPMRGFCSLRPQTRSISSIGFGTNECGSVPISLAESPPEI